MLDSLGLSPASLLLTFASFLGVLTCHRLTRDREGVIPYLGIGFGLAATAMIVTMLASFAGYDRAEGLLACRAPWIPALAGGVALIAHRLKASWGRGGSLACTLALVALASTSPATSALLETHRFSAPRWERGVCRQSAPFSCTAAAGATLLNSLGVSSSEDEVALLSGTSVAGTHVLGLAAGVRHKLSSDLIVRAAILEADDLRSVQLPCVAFAPGHAFVVFAIDAATGEVEIGDSTAGRLRVSWERLEERFVGEVLLVTSAGAEGVVDGSEFEILPGRTEGLDAQGEPLTRFGSADAEPW